MSPAAGNCIPESKAGSEGSGHCRGYCLSVPPGSAREGLRLPGWFKGELCNIAAAGEAGRLRRQYKCRQRRLSNLRTLRPTGRSNLGTFYTTLLHNPPPIGGHNLRRSRAPSLICGAAATTTLGPKGPVKLKNPPADRPVKPGNLFTQPFYTTLLHNLRRSRAPLYISILSSHRENRGRRTISSHISFWKEKRKR